jgi:hypothetical protein
MFSTALRAIEIISWAGGKKDLRRRHAEAGRKGAARAVWQRPLSAGSDAG